MTNENDKYSHIKGWGVDADPDNAPAYPIKKEHADRHDSVWQRPPLQVSGTEILHSNERPYMTAVFGTTLPPSGLSGRLRRMAFRYSESKMQHWLSLLLADRINVIEGLIDDVRQRHIPNILAEKGWKAKWKYDRAGTIVNIAGTIGIAILALTWMAGKRRKRKE